MQLVLEIAKNLAEVKRMATATLATDVAISHGNELMLLMTRISDEKRLRLTTYSFEQEKIDAQGDVDIGDARDFNSPMWEVYAEK